VRAQAAPDDRGHLETTGPTTPVPAARLGPPAGPPGHPRPVGRQPWSPQADPQVGRLLAEGKTPYAIRKELGLSDRKYKAVCKYRDDLQAAAQNGDRPKEPVP
jgi:hypothetical protein